MKNTKRMISAAMALVLCLMLMPAGIVSAAEVQTGGYENGNGLDLNKIGSYISGISNPDGGVAEIVSYDAVENKAWVVNGATGMLDILDLNNMEGGAISATSLDIKALAAEVNPGFFYGDMTSVSVCADLRLVAVALQAEDYDAVGYVGILNTDGEMLAMIEAGFQPDMVTFTPDGTKILVANEGEPRNGYGEDIIDPLGSVTIIWLNSEDPASSAHRNVGFEEFDEKREELVASGIMLTKGNLPSADLEPEYIACDNDTAYITLQEANAVAILDLVSGTYRGVYSLGYQNLSLEENALDLIEDGSYITNTYPDAVAAYMPDGISLYVLNDVAYLVTANEGDAREWGDVDADTKFCNEIKETLIAADGTEAEKVRVIDPEVTDGLPEGKAVLFSSRSFSIFRVDENGLTQVFDSGKDFEELSNKYILGYFNCSNDDNEYDSRSPKKGPEPESVTVGTVGNDLYAFIALERIGGIMAYKIDVEGETASFVNYINTRDFSEDPSEAEPHLTSDVAPEGLCFIPESGTLLAAFEVSGTVSAYSVGNTGTFEPEPTVPETTASEVTEPTVSDTVEAVEPTNPWMVILAVIVVTVVAVVFVLTRKK